MTYKKLLFWPVGTLYLLVSSRPIVAQLEFKITVDGLLGTSEVNRLDTAGLLEMRSDSRLGSSSHTSSQSRDKGALLCGRSG